MPPAGIFQRKLKRWTKLLAKPASSTSARSPAPAHRHGHHSPSVGRTFRLPAQQIHPRTSSSGAQRLFARGQRQSQTLRKLEVAGVIRCQAEPIRQTPRRRPGIAICFEIGTNIPIRQRAIAIGNPRHQRINARRRFVPKALGQNRRAIKDQAHFRPSSISSRMVMPGPRVICLRRSNIRSCAARARPRSGPALCGTSLATGLPCRVMVSS